MFPFVIKLNTNSKGNNLFLIKMMYYVEIYKISRLTRTSNTCTTVGHTQDTELTKKIKKNLVVIQTLLVGTPYHRYQIYKSTTHHKTTHLLIWH